MTEPILISFNGNNSKNGELVAYQNSTNIPFDIKRVFTIKGKNGDVRGDHAHKECVQLLICVAGQIAIEWDNGQKKACVTLNSMDKGLLIPAYVWAKQEYVKSGSVLMVLCDQLYDENDYIRNYSEYVNLLKTR